MSLPPNGTGHCALSDNRITVAVLTFNRVAEVQRTLCRLSSGTAPPRVIVVDNASSDGTEQALSGRTDISYIRLARNMGAAARNVAVRQASSAYVALCDDDTWWEPQSLSLAADILDRCPRHGLLVGRVLVGEAERLDSTCEVMAASPLPSEPDDPGPPLLGFLAGASVVRRSMFLAAGGFDERLFIGGEEALLAIDFATRGFRMCYVPELAVHHFPSSARDMRTRGFYLQRNAIWTAWLRRPRSTAVKVAFQAIREALRDPVAGRALPWVIACRKPVPAGLEQQLRELERANHRPGLGGATPLQRSRHGY